MNIPQYPGCMVAALISIRCPRVTFTSDNTNLYTYDLETMKRKVKIRWRECCDVACCGLAKFWL